MQQETVYICTAGKLTYTNIISSGKRTCFMKLCTKTCTDITEFNIHKLLLPSLNNSLSSSSASAKRDLLLYPFIA